MYRWTMNENKLKKKQRNKLLVKPNDFHVIFKMKKKIFSFLVPTRHFFLLYALVNAADLVLIFHVKMNEIKKKLGKVCMPLV